MDIKIAARETAKLIDKSYLRRDHPEIGATHLHGMVRKIQDGIVEGEKAHRWLGWVQACICFGKGATLEQLKEINFRA